MNTLSRFLKPVLAALALFAMLADAWPHAALVGSDPADGALLSRPPERIHLTFSEPVSPQALSLVGHGGEPVRLDSFHLHDRTLVIEAPPELADGTYVLSWRVASADGHPIGGSVVFSIGMADDEQPLARSESAGALPKLVWLARFALYLGLFLGVGALAFHAFVAPAPGARRAAVGLLAVGLASVAPSAALQGLDLVGAPLERALGRDVWAAAWSSSYMNTLLIAAAAMLAGLIAWLPSARGAVRPLAGAALLGVGLALAVSGHAGNASPQWLTRPAIFLHGVGVAFWTGSLLPFALALKGGRNAVQPMLRRFSAAILPTVAVLTVAGLLLAAVQLERIDALWTTAYGRVLAAKLALLLFLFTLAAINRFSLTPAFNKREAGVTRQFVRSVRLELALICVILAVVALWRFTPPPRSLAVEEAPAALVHLHSGTAMARLTIAPGRPGPVSASVALTTGHAEPMQATEVTLALSNVAAGIEPIRRAMRPLAEGQWTSDALVLPVPGTWTAQIDVLVSDFEKITLEGDVAIAP